MTMLCRRMFVNRQKLISFLDTKENLDLTSFINQDVSSGQQSFSVDRFKETLNISNLKEVSFSYSGPNHPFDQSHPQSSDIYDVLNDLYERNVKTSIRSVSSNQLVVFQNAKLTRLTFDSDGSRLNLQRHHLPNTLKYLVLPLSFRDTLDDLLPDGLNILNLLPAYKWNQPIKPGSLPNQLRSISLPGFNQVIQSGTFPSSLRSIMFGSNFNQPLNGVLPPSLTSLDLSIGPRVYAHDLTNLPSSLTTIRLPPNFRHSLKHPPLQQLHVNSHVPTGHPFPKLTVLYIKYLEKVSDLDHSFSSSSTPPLIPNLVRLTINHGGEPIDISTSLPWSTLKYCRVYCAGKANAPSTIITGPIPFGVEELILGRCELSQLASPGSLLPSSITRLSIDHSIFKLRPGDLPSSVTSLDLKIMDLKRSLDDIVNNINMLFPVNVREIALNFASQQQDHGLN
ncbi:hypothetical protein SAMD00019534_049400 [Acytostelium subglobosum LB1]|uniref:hypothetical protein n=1 Tax=Acytostelium subglobosum LB1 TaxID=1410327 RepID=UPI000644C585|nr:hypothetical protein SAMD00019534_049400 [Acytostelium subglobosum LB1]GAM21765.1 hypothetical protein SAMD00019534_049400 [Acytostelium subglobosum LB1]|eukprot:XP_012754865.1 hypothetical protein SAMD00019534_049400 [Acytostelium subglobosum LB1]